MSRRRRRGREVNGILLLDKPAGITSNAALQKAKALFQAQKAGHTGSLDPLATGLLPLCFGEATKMSAFLLEADKRYEVGVRLGVTTTTGDAEGEVVETKTPPPLDEQKLVHALAQFVGQISQIPPMHSAIKKNGQPLYKLAHQGMEVEREPRQVTIHSVQFVNFNENRLDFTVHCSKGTYIRTLAEDLGKALGCGGHVVALRRTSVGPFKGADMVTLSQLELACERGGETELDGLLLPLDSAVAAWPDVQVSTELAFFLSRGQPVTIPHAPSRGWVKLYKGNKRFLGVGCVMDDGRVSPKRLLRI